MKLKLLIGMLILCSLSGFAFYDFSGIANYDVDQNTIVLMATVQNSSGFLVDANCTIDIDAYGFNYYSDIPMQSYGDTSYTAFIDRTSYPLIWSTPEALYFATTSCTRGNYTDEKVEPFVMTNYTRLRIINEVAVVDTNVLEVNTTTQETNTIVKEINSTISGVNFTLLEGMATCFSANTGDCWKWLYASYLNVVTVLDNWADYGQRQNYDWFTNGTNANAFKANVSGINTTQSNEDICRNAAGIWSENISGVYYNSTTDSCVNLYKEINNRGSG